MVALRPPHDAIYIDLKPAEDGDEVGVEMQVVRRREALRSARVARALGSTQCTGDSAVVLDSSDPTSPSPVANGAVAAGMPVLADHWPSAAVLSLCKNSLMANEEYALENMTWRFSKLGRKEEGFMVEGARRHS